MVSQRTILAILIVGCISLGVMQLTAATPEEDEAFNKVCTPEFRRKFRKAVEACYDEDKCIMDVCYWMYLKDEEILREVAQKEDVNMDVYDMKALKKIFKPMQKLCTKPKDYKEPKLEGEAPPCIKHPEESDKYCN